MKNNNLSVLPWYDSIEKQDFKKSYAFGAVYPLFMLKGYINPFQIVNIDVDDFDDGYTIELVNFQTGVAVNVTTAMSPYISVAYVTGIFGNVIFMTDQPVITSPKIGRYFLRITTALHQYFSDVITFVDSVSPFLKLEWWDVNDLQLEYGTLFYGNYGFQNLLYLQTELGKPEYTFTDEGEERNGYFFPTKQISEKVFKFNFLSSEYLLDVMRLIRMSDYIRITDPFGRCYNANQFEIKSEWETQGNLASATVQFQTDAVVKKIALPVLVVVKDYISIIRFHNLVLTSATEIHFELYDQSPDLSGFTLLGTIDNNGHIQCWRNGTVYKIVNPSNNSMYCNSMSDFFYNYTYLTFLDISCITFENITNLHQTFQNTPRLTTILIGNESFPNVTSLFNTFRECGVQNLDFSVFHWQLKSAYAAFYGCRKIVKLDLRNVNFDNCTNAWNIFRDCKSVTEINLGYNTFPSLMDATRFFWFSIELKTIICKSWNLPNSADTSYMFQNCSLLVGGNGTHYSGAHINAEYARVDGEDGLPGYFTAPEP